MKTQLIIWLTLLTTMGARSQESYYHYFDEKTVLRPDSSKILVMFDSTLSKEQQRVFFEENISRFHDSKYTLRNYVTLELMPALKNHESARALAAELKRDPRISFVQPYYLAHANKEVTAINQLVLKFRTGRSVEDLIELMKDDRYARIYTREYLPDIFLVELNRQSPELLSLCHKIYASGMVEFVEPDFLSLNPLSTNDPLYVDQWGIENSGQTVQNGFGNNVNGTPGADIDADLAWQITRGRNDIRIAVLDMGVDLDHADLVENLEPGFDVTNGGTTNGGPGTLHLDFHGTACAGIIAAVADNNVGLAGVCPECHIIPVRISQNPNVIQGTEVSAGITAAQNAGADVMSCSFNVNVNAGVVTAAITNAVTNGRGGLGCVILASSGNDDISSIDFPASLADVIAVGATTPCNKRKEDNANVCDGETGWGSNFGAALDVMAPGVCIASCDITGPQGANALTGFVSFNNDFVRSFNGTSAACPHAAGVVGLMLSVNRCLTFGDVATLLKASCSRVGGVCYTPGAVAAEGTRHAEMGHGLVNARRAVEMAISAQVATGNVGGTDQGGSSNFTFVQAVGCSNLAGGSVIASRHEVRASISYPNTPNPVILGFANGFDAANPNSANFAMVTSNVTSTSADLSTFVYDEFTMLGQPIGFVPTTPGNVFFHFRVFNQITLQNFLQNMTETTTVNREARADLAAGFNVTGSVPTGNYQISSPAVVNIHAGREIALMNGTDINSGSTARIYVLPFFTCTQFPNGRSANPYVAFEYVPMEPIVTSDILPLTAEDFKVYPNPTQDKLTISFTAADSKNEVMIRLTTLLGEVLFEFRNTDKVPVGRHDIILSEVSGLKPGAYLLTTEIDNQVTTTKFVKVN